MTNAELLQLADSIDVPPWATHVAVRRDGSKIEPACWHEASHAYLDEDPAGLTKDEWAGCYREAYWRFFGIADLAKDSK